MAGELRGALLEALLVRAVIPLAKRRKLDLSYGSSKHDLLSVTPDLLLCDSTGYPKVLFLVTASDSSSDANRKFWRNFIEIAEAKHLDNPPLVFDLTVEESTKELYEAVRQNVFDACIRLPDKVKFSFYLLFDEIEKSLNAKATIDDCIAEMANLSSNGKIFASEVEISLNSQIEKLISSVAGNKSDLWKATKEVRERIKPLIPDERRTSFTRGTAKLLMFYPEERTSILDSLYSGKKIKSFPAELEIVELARKTIGGYTITDPEIIDAVNLVDREVIDGIIALTPTEKYSTYVDQIRQFGEHGRACTYIQKAKVDLSNKQTLLKMMTQVFNGEPVDPFEKGIGYHWMFDGILSLYRVVNNGKMAGFYNAIEATTGIAKSVQRYHYPRLIRLEEDLPINLKEEVCKRFAVFLSDVDDDALTEAIEKMQASVLQNLIECKLIQHGIRPLQRLFEIAFEKRTGEMIACSAIDSPLSSQSYFLSTEGYVVGDSVVISKSVTEKGRMHKVKELRSKVLQLRVQKNCDNRFCGSKAITNVFMLIDGTFSRDDFYALSDAGIDGFFYPDEVDLLIDRLIQS
jgi:hypothetical protein